jgi:hypothetical protein
MPDLCRKAFDQTYIFLLVERKLIDNYIRQFRFSKKFGKENYN